MIATRPVLVDSRRLTGPHLLADRHGALVEACCAPEDARPLADRFRVEARNLLREVGWALERVVVRTHAEGAQLFVTAPLDGLHAACDLAEVAFARAVAGLAGETVAPLEAAALRARIAGGSRPRLYELENAARAHRVQFLADDELVTIGSGRGSSTFAVDDLPSTDAIDWSRVHDVPTALVTGTNGKSTTVRLTEAIAARGGRVVGTSSTDGVHIGGAAVMAGDYSGPEGARAVLRDRRVDVAVLEIARGGLLRRGLAVARATIATVLNVGDDHLGEFGVFDLDTLARVKLLVSRALAGGRLLLNADDHLLRRIAASDELDSADHEPPRRRLPRIGWFGRRAGSHAPFDAFVRSGVLSVIVDGRVEPILDVAAIPSTLGGASRTMVENALAASALAISLGSSSRDVALGLAEFAHDPSDNPGRGNLFEFGGVRAYVDFAHNPEAVRGLFEMARALRATRVGIVVGQAGDRSDAAVRHLAREVWAGRPDRIVLKPLRHHLRGRPEGAMLGLLESSLREAGAPASGITRGAGEFDAIRDLLLDSRPGDLLLVLVHEERDRVLRWMRSLTERAWRPGTPLPA